MLKYESNYHVCILYVQNTKYIGYLLKYKANSKVEA